MTGGDTHRGPRPEPLEARGAFIGQMELAMPTEIYDQATKVDAEDGHVILDGPDGVDVSMTPAAAEETAEHLLEGAAKANGQMLWAAWEKKPTDL